MKLSSLQRCIAFIVIAFFSGKCSGEPTAAISTLPTAPLTEQQATDSLTPAAPITFSAKTNNGWTLLAKFHHQDASIPIWEPIIEVGSSDGSHSIRMYKTWKENERNFWYKSPNTASMSDNVCYGTVDISTLTENTWITFVAQYDGRTETWVIDFDGQVSKTETCIAGSLMDAELTRIWPVRANFAGLRLYDSLLTGAEVASELDKICVDADTCGDVLTAGCDSAPACPVPTAEASPCPTGLIAQYQFDGDDSSIELAYGGVPPADKWSWDAAGVHFTCNDANYFGTESVPVHESGNYDAACLQGGNSAWLQLDLGGSMFVTGIVTQGRPDWEQYVKRYTVQGSIDGITWIDMPCKNVDSLDRCIGSSDRSTKVTNEFAQVVNVRYVKLFVKDYYVYASLRMSVYKSEPIISCVTETCLEQANFVFNPASSTEETFDGSRGDIETSLSIPMTTDGDGWTVISKMQYDSSAATWDAVFDLNSDTSNLGNIYATLSATNTLRILVHNPGSSTKLCSVDSAAIFVPDVSHAVIITFSTQSETLTMTVGNNPETTTSCAGFVSRTYNALSIGTARQWNNAEWNGKIYGLYFFDNLVDSSQAQQLVSRIVEGGSDEISCSETTSQHDTPANDAPSNCCHRTWPE